MALTMVCTVKAFEKSGLRKNSYPSFAPGIIAARTAIANIIKKRIGITTSAVRSKPLRTPRETMKWVAKMKSIV